MEVRVAMEVAETRHHGPWHLGHGLAAAAVVVALAVVLCFCYIKVPTATPDQSRPTVGLVELVVQIVPLPVHKYQTQPMTAQLETPAVSEPSSQRSC
jgi:hypothetical protein